MSQRQNIDERIDVPWKTTLVPMLSGEMDRLWYREKQYFLSINNKLSQSRAGELAAALLARRFYDEGRLFEEHIFKSQTGRSDAQITYEDESLYDALNAMRGINRDLELLSGSRTLLSDMDTVKQQRKDMENEKLRRP